MCFARAGREKAKLNQKNMDVHDVGERPAAEGWVRSGETVARLYGHGMPWRQEPTK